MSVPVSLPGAIADKIGGFIILHSNIGLTIHFKDATSFIVELADTYSEKVEGDLLFESCLFLKCIR